MRRIKVDEMDIWRGKAKSTAEEQSKKRLSTMLTIRDPDYAHDRAPYAWRVFKGLILVGAYRSRWEAEQCRKRIIIHGGDLYNEGLY